MRNLLLAAAILAVPGVAMADPVYGTWKTQAGETGGHLHVNISACGGQICGTIAKAIEASGNVGADYEHLGKNIIKGMSAKGSGAYKGGTIWAPDTDKTYKSKMALSGNSLKVSGCVGPICRSQTWTRIK